MRTFSISRRGILRGAAALTGVAAGGIGDVWGAGAPAAGPSLNVFSDYGWLRGFSVVPSWGARIEGAWRDYDASRFREEISPAPQVHTNCIRLWIEFSAWMAAPDKVAGDFADAVKAVGELGMKTMPCLFNRWHDSRFDYGGSYIETLGANSGPQRDYLKALVTPFAQDDRVLVWDLCNEPQARDLATEANQREFAWLKFVSETVRACGARQPITIGTMNGGNIETFAPLMDVLCAHPYRHTREDLESLISGYLAMRKSHGKPFLINETIPGSLDDEVRASGARYYTELLSGAGLGWMGWALREGLAISTRRDRVDGNGFNGDGFHPFFTKEGKLRNGLEFLTEKPKLLPPWQNP